MQTTNTLPFTKMHGLGNDFIIIYAPDLNVSLDNIPVAQLADRHLGIGFDQMLVLEPSQSADFSIRIFNADGSEAEQCGNGLRCVARYIHERGLHPQSTCTLATKAGVFSVDIHQYDKICIAMGAPIVEANLTQINLPSYPHQVSLSLLSLGNPHAIISVETLQDSSLNQLANEVSVHANYPHGINVGLMQVLSRDHIRLRTYERGVGETNACGSNACAAVVAGIVNGWLNHEVRVEYRLGSLLVKWDGDTKPIYMTGPAETVYRGEMTL